MLTERKLSAFNDKKPVLSGDYACRKLFSIIVITEEYKSSFLLNAQFVSGVKRMFEI